MALGFVLISVEPGFEGVAFKRLLEETAVKELFPLFGDYDLLAKVEAVTFDELGRMVVARIRAIDGVRDTVTLTVTSLVG